MKLFTTLSIVILCGQVLAQHPARAELIEVNDIEIYYEQFGEGEPLLLLHGWTQSGRFWKDYVESFTEKYSIYSIDLRGHGKSSPLKDDFSIEKAAADIMALTNSLQLKNFKAIGLSYGGLVLLQMARMQPQALKAMVLIGASHQYNGQDSNALDDTFKFEQLPQSFKTQLLSIHAHGEEQIKALFNPDLNYKIQLSNEELRSVSARALIISGDRDEILGIDHALSLYENLPNSALWIVPGAGHIPITGPNKPIFITRVNSFLSNPGN